MCLCVCVYVCDWDWHAVKNLSFLLLYFYCFLEYVMNIQLDLYIHYLLPLRCHIYIQVCVSHICVYMYHQAVD